MKRSIRIALAVLAVAALAACHGHYSVGYEVHGHGHWRHRGHHPHHPHHGHHFYAITVGH